MNLPHPPAVMMDMIKQEQIRRESEKSIMGFIKNAWGVIEPGVEFRDNWHLHAIAEHLEALSDGEIDNLVIAVPPGCMKSILVSVAFPAWEWMLKPELRYMGASYGIDLAIRDSQKCRDIITSDWYQRNWGERVQIKPGEDQKTKYALTAGGWRMATSVGGRATGEHPDRKIVDDPHNAKQAESDAERESALTWFDRTLSTRGQSRGARTIVVAQRFHERDLTGHILADIKGYDYLCVPMEFESRKPATSIGWVDPRKVKGELLWPEMFPEKSVTELKQLLGAYGTSGQLAQEPTPSGGGMLKTDCFKMWPSAKQLPALEFVVQSLDTAFTDKTTGDPSACTVWGVFTLNGEKQAMLVDAWDEHLAYPELRKRVIDDWSSEYGGSTGGSYAGMPVRPRRADRILVEAKASGQSLIQDLRQARIPVVPYNPGGSDKVARAHQMAPVLELGLLWIPESKKNPGQFVSWAVPLINQMSKFPVSQHDDLVDSASQAVIFMKNEYLIAMPQTHREDRDERPPKKDRLNPYGA